MGHNSAKLAHVTNYRHLNQYTKPTSKKAFKGVICSVLAICDQFSIDGCVDFISLLNIQQTYFEWCMRFTSFWRVDVWDYTWKQLHECYFLKRIMLCFLIYKGQKGNFLLEKSELNYHYPETAYSVHSGNAWNDSDNKGDTNRYRSRKPFHGFICIYIICMCIYMR